MIPNVSIKKNLKLPKALLVQDDLVTIAEKIFIPILKNNIDKEVDLQEKKYPPLSPITLAIKKRAGLSPMILQATGQLRTSFGAKKRGKNTVLVSIASNRKEIGHILQEVGVRSKRYGVRFFNFFGISTRMENEAIKFMKAKIEKVLKDAR